MSMHALLMSRPHTRSRGVTLIELLVALLISVVVLGAVGSVYFNTKRTYNIQDGFARMQEGALFAFQRMTQDLSIAGFAGCNPVVSSMLNTTVANAGLFDFVDGVYGWEYTGTGPGSNYAMPALLASGSTAGNWTDNNGQNLLPNFVGAGAGKVLPGSDILVIKSATENTSLVPNADINPGTSTISLALVPPATQTGIQQGTVLLVSDCNKADLFMNSDVATSATLDSASSCGGYLPCNKAGATWSHAYIAPNAAGTNSMTAGIRLYTTISRSYYIGQAANGEPALFFLDYDGVTPQELVEGVENMQILYGVNKGGPALTPTQYVTYDNVADPLQIVSVRISLLMRSTADLNRQANNLNPCTSAASTCLVGGVDPATAVTVTPFPAKRLYKVFTSTIALRNMQVTGR